MDNNKNGLNNMENQNQNNGPDDRKGGPRRSSLIVLIVSVALFLIFMFSGSRMMTSAMQEEIDYRIKVLTPKLKEELSRARAQGDLSENFEYKSAKRELSRNYSRIDYLQRMIATAGVVSTDSEEGTGGLFNKVCLYVEEDDEEMNIVIVTTLRQNSTEGFISKESPLGKAVMGKKVGDRATVKVNDNYSYDVIIRSVEKGEDDESLDISSY